MEAIAGAAGLRHSLLLETDPAGRFSHLELATPSGLLTIHPEPGATLHGNVLESGGLRHVVGVAWDADGVVDIAGSVVCGPAAAIRLRNAVDAVDERATLDHPELVAGGPQRSSARRRTWRMAAGVPDDRGCCCATRGHGR
jgi:hypothetical protein